jgi:hypothetical protein
MQPKTVYMMKDKLGKISFVGLPDFKDFAVIQFVEKSPYEMTYHIQDENVRARATLNVGLMHGNVLQGAKDRIFQILKEENEK